MNPFCRTFHPDEANQAFTTGRLLETGSYVYRPTDHHGPTLYYAAAALQKPFGHVSVATLDGNLLRATPLLFALLALALGALAVFKVLRRAGAARLAACAPALGFVGLLAAAPLFVFFATDFIQEMLLACFLVGLFAAAVFRHPWWFGLAAGLAFATKETSVLSFAAAAFAWVVVYGLPRLRDPHRDIPFANPHKIVLALLVAALTSVTLFSSFCTNWQGVYDAFIAAPLSYIGRAAGDGAASEGAAWHVHPWWQYLDWLLGRDAFAETVLVFVPLLAVPLARAVIRFRRPDAPTSPCDRPYAFTLLYALTLLAILSAIPYKTPWCALQLVPAFAFATIFGLQSILDRVRLPPRFACVLFLFIVADAAAFRAPALRLVWNEPDSEKIPYNYASASPEVKDIAAFVAPALAAPTSAGPNTPFLAVALPPADTWPLPWYNRAHEDRTGYWTSFEDLEKLAQDGIKPAAVIVPMTEGHRVQPLFPHLKETKRFYVRPGVRVRAFR